MFLHFKFFFAILILLLAGYVQFLLNETKFLLNEIK